MSHFLRKHKQLSEINNLQTNKYVFNKCPKPNNSPKIKGFKNRNCQK